jgi:hypothetical protein
MRDTHEVISAFLDDAPFDSRELAEALSEPAGRELLIDLIALRHLVVTEGDSAHERTVHRPARSPFRALIGVAAVLVALAGGYVAGQYQRERPASTAPAATRVVAPAERWQVVTERLP